MFSLKGKTAVITGGGSGIGASMVFRFAQQGAQVAILEVDLDKAQHFVAKIADPSLKINCYQVNVADQSAVRQVMEDSKCLVQVSLLVLKQLSVHSWLHLL